MDVKDIKSDDDLRFFELPVHLTEESSQYWAAAPYWKCSEAARLLLSLDPNGGIYFSIANRPRDMTLGNQIESVEEWLCRATEIKEIPHEEIVVQINDDGRREVETRLVPKDVIEWARSKNLKVPEILSRYVLGISATHPGQDSNGAGEGGDKSSGPDPYEQATSDVNIDTSSEDEFAPPRFENVSLSKDDADALQQRVNRVWQVEVLAKLPRRKGDARKRLLMLADAIRWMVRVLLSDCKCTHDILAEMTFLLGTDSNGKKFENWGRNPLTDLKRLAKNLVAPERHYGVEGNVATECDIAQHREMASAIRKRRKNKE